MLTQSIAGQRTDQNPSICSSVHWSKLTTIQPLNRKELKYPLLMNISSLELYLIETLLFCKIEGNGFWCSLSQQATVSIFFTFLFTGCGNLLVHHSVYQTSSLQNHNPLLLTFFLLYQFWLVEICIYNLVLPGTRQVIYKLDLWKCPSFLLMAPCTQDMFSLASNSEVGHFSHCSAWSYDYSSSFWQVLLCKGKEEFCFGFLLGWIFLIFLHLSHHTADSLAHFQMFYRSLPQTWWGCGMGTDPSCGGVSHPPGKTVGWLLLSPDSCRTVWSSDPAAPWPTCNLQPSKNCTQDLKILSGHQLPFILASYW